MKIDGVELNEEEHKGIGVIRVARGDWDEEEYGSVTSWNDSVVFVRYGGGDTSAATYPNELVFSSTLFPDRMKATPDGGVVRVSGSEGVDRDALVESLKVGDKIYDSLNGKWREVQDIRFDGDAVGILMTYFVGVRKEDYWVRKKKGDVVIVARCKFPPYHEVLPLAAEEFTPDVYRAFCNSMYDVPPEILREDYLRALLWEELGEVSKLFAKAMRDGNGEGVYGVPAVSREALKKELGDVMWCCVLLDLTHDTQWLFAAVNPDGHKVSPVPHLSDVSRNACMHTISRLCSFLGYVPEEVARYNMEKLKSRKARGVVGGSGDNR